MLKIYKTAKYLKCAYCGIEQHANSMVLVKDSIREEWPASFADEFRKKFEKEEYICIKHMKGFENENEEEDDGIQWFYENGRKICFNMFCCYCGPKTKPIRMCAVPRNYYEMEHWIAVFGTHFRINAAHLRFPCICLRHFDENEVLPRGFLNGIPIDVVIELEKCLPGSSLCSLCKYLRDNRFLVKVPRSDFQFWVNIFGAVLKKNCQNIVDPKICRSHVMEKLPEYTLPAQNICDIYFATPKPTKIQVKAYCCYCGKKDIQMKMMNVPVVRDTFIDWVCEFGMDFEENCSFFRYPMICQTHVIKLNKSDWKRLKCTERNKPIALNPKPDFSIRRIEESFRKRELSEELKPMEPSTSSEFPEDFVLKIEPPEIKQEIEEEEEMDIKPSTSEIKLVPNMNISPEVAKLIDIAKHYEKLFYPRFGKCCYCRSFLSVRHMIRVPNDPKLFENWCEILGNKFKMISNALRYPRICWQHFEDTKTIPIANLKDISFPICCMYCKLARSQGACLDIVTIPASSSEAKKWRKILGIQSINLNLYICFKYLGKNI
ncbi:unnamed protein product [Caenorhabditis angaria]|uniref:Uncharacterized protein n=1 Tax=Caenorhabditis angaria TaxID=860376 RepID=A0A9P1IAE9_9PELO|nr:unnamed protein product [Caenorhabditis angaria]